MTVLFVASHMSHLAGYCQPFCRSDITAELNHRVKKCLLYYLWLNKLTFKTGSLYFSIIITKSNKPSLAGFAYHKIRIICQFGKFLFYYKFKNELDNKFRTLISENTNTVDCFIIKRSYF